ncbi:MAG: hypothetical protein AAFQ08_00740, partial [Bacteroidota bacterium]
MKATIEALPLALPSTKGQELDRIKAIILKRCAAQGVVSPLEMILLFGPYANDHWAEYSKPYAY